MEKMLLGNLPLIPEFNNLRTAREIINRIYTTPSPVSRETWRGE